MSLAIVASFPDWFGILGREPVKRGEGFGCTCAKCGLEITAPWGFERRLLWCLYCGMDAGFVPEIISPYPHQYCFGVTDDECREDTRALDRGWEAFEAMAEARARRRGQIIYMS